MVKLGAVVATNPHPWAANCMECAQPVDPLRSSVRVVEGRVVSICRACSPQDDRDSWVRPLELSEIARYETEMLEYIRTRHGDVLKGIRDSAVLDEDNEQKLVAALDEFAGVFSPASGSGTQAA